MDEAALVRRLMGLTITTAQARKTFPATPPGLFFKAAPPADRGRLLTFGEAFRIASRHAEEAVAEAQIARAAAAQAADLAQRQAACAAPAFDLVAKVIDREIGALADSLRARVASPRAVTTLSLIQGRCARQIGRSRARIARKGGSHAAT